MVGWQDVGSAPRQDFQIEDASDGAGAQSVGVYSGGFSVAGLVRGKMRMAHGCSWLGGGLATLAMLWAAAARRRN